MHQAALVPIRYSATVVDVDIGRSFAPGTALAGYGGFTAYLASVAVDAPPAAPHEYGC